MANAEKKQEDWMSAKWRPAMGWVYMVTCTTDFIIFPILWSLLQAVLKQPVTAWQPITLQGAGLYHLAMGAIIGVSAYGRTQEKLNGANNGGAVVAAPVTVQQPVMMAQPAMATAPMPAAAPTMTLAARNAPAAETVATPIRARSRR